MNLSSSQTLMLLHRGYSPPEHGCASRLFSYSDSLHRRYQWRPSTAGLSLWDLSTGYLCYRKLLHKAPVMRSETAPLSPCFVGSTWWPQWGWQSYGPSLSRRTINGCSWMRFWHRFYGGGCAYGRSAKLLCLGLCPHTLCCKGFFVPQHHL